MLKRAIIVSTVGKPKHTNASNGKNPFSESKTECGKLCKCLRKATIGTCLGDRTMSKIVLPLAGLGVDDVSSVAMGDDGGKKSVRECPSH